MARDVIPSSCPSASCCRASARKSRYPHHTRHGPGRKRGLDIRQTSSDGVRVDRASGAGPWGQVIDGAKCGLDQQKASSGEAGLAGCREQNHKVIGCDAPLRATRNEA